MPVTSFHAPAELWTAADAAAADRYTMDDLGIASEVLMERAALCVARQAMDLLAETPGRVCALAGPGNNGGDAVACARILHGWGIDAAVWLSGPAHRGALARQVAWARACGVEVFDADAPLPEGPCLWIDGLLGTGSRGAPRGKVAARLRELATRNGPVVAVDLPSGVDPDSGAVHEGAARAEVTVTFGRSKPGLHATPGRSHAGRVVVADIGLVPDPSWRPTVRLVDPEQVAASVAALPSGPHKGARGRVVVVGGGATTPGAATLAAFGALVAGAGLVTVASARAEVRELAVAHHAELMVDARTDPGAWDPRWVAVVGPGLTDPDAAEVARAFWTEFSGAAVFDAGALEAIAHVEAAGPRIVTPHPGEAARLLARLGGAPVAVADVQADRIEAARRISRATSAVTVLKGAGTVVADPDGNVRIATEGTAVLATAGTGDVLAGIAGALLARGLAPSDAATCAVHLHARAGEIARREHGGGAPGVVASEVAEALGRAVVEADHADGYPALLRG
ncbi:MAG: NAD(P)H-hydrate dehydratase [Deltaproteobacteria bacterium]|nr:MAG: NAD(P)H-hydrate dehydratase [Deltaproteobacteria bacterium]